MKFALFLVLNAVLLLRPEDLVPELAGARLYLIAIAACIVTALPELTARLTPAALRDRPVTVCVLGVWAAGTLSHFIYQTRLEDGIDFAGEFGKKVLYYLVLTSVVNTEARFRVFLSWLLLCIVTATGMAVLDYEGYVEIPAIQHITERDDSPAARQDLPDGPDQVHRLCSVGIFNDPNDLCLILSLGMLICGYRSVTAGGVLTRVLWLVPVLPLFYAMTLTHSRGGLMGFLAGVGAWLFARYGGRRAVPLGIVAGAALLAFVGGRQASVGGTTFSERLGLWSDGLTDLTNRPLYLPVGFGVGYYVEEYGLHAHNSFMSAYVETGLLGGGFFLGAFYLAGLWVWRAGRDPAAPAWAGPARPFMFAVVAAYGMGCMSISQQFDLPTYVILGMAGAYLELSLIAPPERYQVSARWVGSLAVLSVIGLGANKVLTQGLGAIGP